MTSRKKGERILWYQAIGFLGIILLSWIDELLSLPTRIFGGLIHSDWRESALETLVVLIVWGFVFVLTKRLVSRLYYLEGFLQVCAWCRKIGHDDQWLKVEEYFAKGFDVKTSHGLCPVCARKASDEIAGMKSSRRTESSPPP